MSRRVLITGVGAISGLGLTTSDFWSGLLAGRSSLAPITRFDPAGFASRLASEVPEFAIKDFVPKHYRKATKVMARDIELAVLAARNAVLDAGLVTRGVLEEGATTPTTYPSERMGCHIGAGLIAAETDEMTIAMATARIGSASGGSAIGGTGTGENSFSLRAWGGEGGGGMDQLTPLWLLKYLPNMLACHVTIIHGAEGPSNTITCAEASGLLSIGESTRVIKRGAADLCFSGGAESKVNLMGLLRLELAGWFAPTGDASDGAAIVRPFDPSASGTLAGEGGGILVLEEREAALRRGASAVAAEIVGFGGGHSALGYVDGEDDEGYRFAIENALDDAGIQASQVSAIVPLALGVPQVDRAELGALKRVFGSRLREIPMVTLPPIVGDAPAGVGALQAAAAALCLKNQVIPGRAHSGKPSEFVNCGSTATTPASLEYVLACAGSLGGQNAAVVFKRCV